MHFNTIKIPETELMDKHVKGIQEDDSSDEVIEIETEIKG